ncbi:MAG: hypothetical protein E7589_05245 [Ruminococcaceae bacterium]|nr:hypothetical protein [Oscillospiraceae bacterium]
MWDVPPDLKNYTRREVLKRVVPCILLLALLGYVLFSFGEEIIGTHKALAKMICYPLIMLIPFILTGVPFKMLDSSWTGEIIHVTVKEGLSAANGAARRIYGDVKVIVTIRKTSGKALRYKMQAAVFPRGEGKGNVERALNMYPVGAKVCHLYGTKHIVVIPSTSNTMVLCPVCADDNDKEERACRSCGHTLVKDIKLSKYRK